MYRVCLYIVPETPAQQQEPLDNSADSGDSADTDVSEESDVVDTPPWWVRDRWCNRAVHHRRRDPVGLKDPALQDYEEYDLEQKIDLEIKMREGTTKLLAACKHQAQSLEAAKNLLTSNERMSAYMSELQRRKKEVLSRGISLARPSRARLSLSDLRMPLIWRDTDHFKNKGDYRRFSVFCLARVGTEIYDTTSLCPVDRCLTDLTFPDIISFNNVPPDFEFRLEVYSHILQDDLTMASTPRKIKKTIHSSISRTVGKKLAASLKDELNTGKIGPRFELMATARLTLEDVHDDVRTHDLQLQNVDTRSHQLPLFGHFCCRMAAQPDCYTQEACSGDVVVHHAGTKPSQGYQGWAQLQAFKLDVWKTRAAWEDGQTPSTSVPVDKDTVVKSGPGKDIVLVRLRAEEGIVLQLRTAEEQQRWLRSLVQHADDHRRWRHAAQNFMRVLSPGGAGGSGGYSRNSFTRGLRQGSLYDQTPLIETVASSRPSVQDIFGLTPSTSLSSCASSSSDNTTRRSTISQRSFFKRGS